MAKKYGNESKILTFYELDGNNVCQTLPKDAIEDFGLTGLNNMDFYLTKFWKTKKPKKT